MRLECQQFVERPRNKILQITCLIRVIQYYHVKNILSFIISEKMKTILTNHQLST